jgi:hypothetical protein
MRQAWLVIGLVLLLALIGCASQPQTPGQPPRAQMPLPCNVVLVSGKPQVFCSSGGITVPRPWLSGWAGMSWGCVRRCLSAT